MKKLLVGSFIFFGVFLVFGSSPTSAVSPVSKEERQEMIQAKLELRKQVVQEKKDEIKLRIEQKRATRQAQLAERKQERIRLYFGRLNGRFEAVIARLEVLIERIESRIVKLSENPDTDTGDVEDQLEEAKDLLSEVEAELEAANSSLEEVLDANDPKMAFEVMKDTIFDLKSKLKDVHSILVHLIGDIRGLHEGLGNTKTSTQSAEVD
jgi:hypothetical protein